VRKNACTVGRLRKKRTGLIEMGLNTSSYNVLLTEDPPPTSGTLQLKAGLLVTPRWTNIILHAINGKRGERGHRKSK
jgi:hypothetical protein